MAALVLVPYLKSTVDVLATDRKLLIPIVTETAEVRTAADANQVKFQNDENCSYCDGAAAPHTRGFAASTGGPPCSDCSYHL